MRCLDYKKWIVMDCKLFHSIDRNHMVLNTKRLNVHLEQYYEKKSTIILYSRRKKQIGVSGLDLQRHTSVRKVFSWDSWSCSSVTSLVTTQYKIAKCADNQG